MLSAGKPASTVLASPVTMRLKPNCEGDGERGSVSGSLEGQGTPRRLQATASVSRSRVAPSASSKVSVSGGMAMGMGESGR